MIYRLSSCHADLNRDRGFADRRLFIEDRRAHNNEVRALQARKHLVDDTPRIVGRAGGVDARAQLRPDLIPIQTAERRIENVSAIVCHVSSTGEPRAGPINKLSEVFADPHVLARDMVVQMAHGSGEAVKVIANPVRLSETPPDYRIPPPLLGEHTDAVLSEQLGLDAAALADLRAKGVI